MSTEENVLNVLKASGKALKSGEIAIVAKIDKKEVDKAIKNLKDSGQITSPKKCFYQAK